MSTVILEPGRPLASLESIKAYLAGVIVAAAHERGSKVQLTYVGGEFAKVAGATFEKHLNILATEGLISLPVSKRKMAPFIESFCKDLITLEKLPSGSFVVFPADSEAAQLAPPDESARRATLTFKRPVWAAFIRPLGAAKRFLNLENIGFTDADACPGEGTWKEIGAEYILGAETDAPIDGVDMQSRIERWAQEAGVSISTLVVARVKAPGPGRRLDALLEIIDTLPPALAISWTIPAAVLKHLRHAR
jgi:hypothetical protein